MELQFKRNQGFTMVELIVTLLIAGILAAMAAVAYNEYVKRSRLAEASTIIDALTKSEVTYYVDHKSFVTFIVPTTIGLGSVSGTIPNLGSKMVVDSTKPSIFSGHVVGSPDFTAPWKAVGAPLPNGSAIGFFVWAASGKNDSTGNPTSGTTEMQQYSLQANSPLMSFVGVSNPTGTNISCILDLGYDQFAQNMNIPDKAWVVINTFANFNDDANDPRVPRPGESNNYPNTGECTRVYKYVETNAQGKVVTGNPIATVSFGH